MIRTIDVLSYNNKLRIVPPMWKSGFAAALVFLAYLTHPVVELALFGWMLVWTIGYAKIPLRYYGAFLGASCLFFIGSLPVLLLEIEPAGSAQQMTHGIIVGAFSHMTLYLNWNGLHLAMKLFVRILACLSATLFLILTTPMTELFQVMRKLRVPHLVLELMLITYRFLFLLADTAHDIYVAQRARGGQQGFRGRLQDTAVLVVRLFGKTMQRYQGLANGMISRGFTEDIRMAPYEAEPMPGRYKLEMYGGVVLLIAAECWLRWRGMR
ncbi:Cobalt transport protein CbiQ [Paenibacillus konkukensis]|uniref:Cobalt transport protein CbiQ n=1 Tax=Paenibacillus konkukensis TaxID=2020716 RepID=A0ABY4RGZ1_9BACL|nr:cobalt ECF transporter T component CbiQ [Paenibacillus konkukensis]UQZ81706.1 Cobalt transport protein CbiQ [Paenibacillus konkukensis]